MGQTQGAANGQDNNPNAYNGQASYGTAGRHNEFNDCFTFHALLQPLVSLPHWRLLAAAVVAAAAAAATAATVVVAAAAVVVAAAAAAAASFLPSLNARIVSSSSYLSHTVSRCCCCLPLMKLILSTKGKLNIDYN